jgi:hypothetical protein
LIAALPAGPSVRADPGRIAARLVALLPRRTVSNIPPTAMSRALDPAIDVRGVLGAVFIFLALVLSVQFVEASRQAPAQLDSAHAPTSTAVSPQVAPPISGQ